MATRILLVDDEPVERGEVKEVLARQGYLVVAEASDGQEAVKLARETRPDLIIAAVPMPGMEGISVAETLSQEKIAPVVLLAPSGEQSLVERAKDAGVVSYIVKPLRECEVAPAVEVALAVAHKYRTLEEHARMLADQLETRKVIERAKGLLMKQQGLSEQEAFRKIQRASMNSRMPMREVADAILLANSL